jgi:hypothetical protein
MGDTTWVWVRVAVIGLALMSPSSGRAQVSCGDVISDDRIMTADLNGCIGTAVTVGSGGSLDMNGYTIDTPGGVGVAMNGDGGLLKNGSIRLCGLSGVVITGAGNKVQNVSVRTCLNGFEISGPKSKMERAVAIQNTNEGFLVLGGGAKTQIKQSYAYNNTADGFQIDGEGSKLAGVVAHDNSSAGVRVGAAKVKVTDTLALENNNDGIVVAGIGATLQRVTSVQNGGRDIGLDSTGAKLKQGTTVRNGGVASIWISGNGNSVDKTTAGFGFNNLFIAGNENKAQRLLSVGASEAGIDLFMTASENSLKKSFSTFSGNMGIRASASSSLNQLKENVATDSIAPFDLFDGNLGCGTNTWEKNSGVANDSCID